MTKGTEVVQREGGEVVAQPQTEAQSFLAMIERASRDPSVDVDKMERLMSMAREMRKTQAETEFNDAMTACQREIGTIAADATNPQTRSKYATFAKLDKVLRPIYTKHGISISYGTGDSPAPEIVRVIAYVARGAHTRMYQVDMPADGKGAKGGDVMTKTHATGAAIAYGSRYLLKAIFNVAVGEEDRDGNNVRGMPEKQKTDFEAAIEALTDMEASKKLWQRITDASITSGDMASHEYLKALMAKKRASFK